MATYYEKYQIFLKIIQSFQNLIKGYLKKDMFSEESRTYFDKVLQLSFNEIPKDTEKEFFAIRKAYRDIKTKVQEIISKEGVSEQKIINELSKTLNLARPFKPAQEKKSESTVKLEGDKKK